MALSDTKRFVVRSEGFLELGEHVRDVRLIRVVRVVAEADPGVVRPRLRAGVSRGRAR